MKGPKSERTVIAEGLVQCSECGAYALLGDRFCACCGVALFDMASRAELEDIAENFCSCCGQRLQHNG